MSDHSDDSDSFVSADSGGEENGSECGEGEMGGSSDVILASDSRSSSPEVPPMRRPSPPFNSRGENTTMDTTVAAASAAHHSIDAVSDCAPVLCSTGASAASPSAAAAAAAAAVAADTTAVGVTEPRGPVDVTTTCRNMTQHAEDNANRFTARVSQLGVGSGVSEELTTTGSSLSAAAAIVQPPASAAAPSVSAVATAVSLSSPSTAICGHVSGGKHPTATASAESAAAVAAVATASAGDCWDEEWPDLDSDTECDTQVLPPSGTPSYQQDGPASATGDQCWADAFDIVDVDQPGGADGSATAGQKHDDCGAEGWGAWESWGSSLLTSARHVTRSVMDQMEAGLAIPRPEQLAQETVALEKQQQQQQQQQLPAYSSATPGGGVGGEWDCTGTQHQRSRQQLESAATTGGAAGGATAGGATAGGATASGGAAGGAAASGGASGGWLGGVSRVLGDTSSLVVGSGLIDTLELIGRGTLHVLESTAGAEQLAAVRQRVTSLAQQQQQPTLAQTLRELQNRTDFGGSVNSRLESNEAGSQWQSTGFSALFDTSDGSVHWEALQILAEDCRRRVSDWRSSNSNNNSNNNSDHHSRIEQSLDTVQRVCCPRELADSENIDNFNAELKLIMSKFKLPLSASRLIIARDSWRGSLRQFASASAGPGGPSVTPEETRRRCLHCLVELAAGLTQLCHKLATLWLAAAPPPAAAAPPPAAAAAVQSTQQQQQCSSSTSTSPAVSAPAAGAAVGSRHSATPLVLVTATALAQLVSLAATEVAAAAAAHAELLVQLPGQLAADTCTDIFLEASRCRDHMLTVLSMMTCVVQIAFVLHKSSTTTAAAAATHSL